MKKTELIKNALYSRVRIEDNEFGFFEGWLIPDNDLKGSYDILPFSKEGPMIVVTVSVIRHIWHLNNGVRIW